MLLAALPLTQCIFFDLWHFENFLINKLRNFDIWEGKGFVIPYRVSCLESDRVQSILLMWFFKLMWYFLFCGQFAYLVGWSILQAKISFRVDYIFDNSFFHIWPLVYFRIMDLLSCSFCLHNFIALSCQVEMNFEPWKKLCGNWDVTLMPNDGRWHWLLN